MSAAIELHGLSKSYKEKVAVSPMTLTINQGELFGLLGVNGAGKTTVINMLSGLTKPSTGDALVLGHSLSKELPGIRKLLAVSPQETSIAPNLSVRENLLLMARIHGFSKEKSFEKTEALISQFSLQPYEHQRGKNLSGGWQRKLSIAMALIANPQILFLDEPTLGLDIISRRELWAMINILRETTTIVLTTHYLEEAESLCDRICIMKDGEIKALGTVDELLTTASKENFEDAFVHFVTGGEL
ncbi:ABC transporter ATP-binding protein [Psychrobacillus sp. FSL W7-1457]|uniref:ABC transporter ATP-binding protein n=1 Tax=unclassified Psychrobacillus TaxID=2636677 RepID=UPI0030FA585D